jgi:hypothetical protein
MKPRLSSAAKTAAIVGALTLAGLAGSVTAASAHYTTTRCYGDQCRVVRCDNDGDNCYTIRAYYRGGYDRDRYYNSGYYDDHRYWDRGRRWVCDRDGDDCHWSYRSDRDYWDY